MEPIIRPCDYDCQTFEELKKHTARVLLKVIKNFPAAMVGVFIDLIPTFTSYIVWEPKLYMGVDMYWPPTHKLYKAIIINISTDQQRFEIRYLGWTKDWNEWVDINYNMHDYRLPVSATEDNPSGSMGRIFPDQYLTTNTRVGSSMCVRSKCLARKESPVFKKGMWVVTHDFRRDSKYLAIIIKVDYDCDPLMVKTDRGGGKCWWNAGYNLWALRTPPTEWVCECANVAVRSLWCDVCGAMWNGL